MNLLKYNTKFIDYMAFVLFQPVRFRHVPDPGTLEQRLFKAVTKPVLPPSDLNPVEKRIRREQERRIREQNNPYRKFLVERAKEEFFKPLNNHILLIFQPLNFSQHEFYPLKNKLFSKGMYFKGFPVSILREAAKGTRFENFSKFVLHTEMTNLYLFTEPSPENCLEAIKITRSVPFILLLGGIVDYRLMTVDQLTTFAGYSSYGLNGIRSQLIDTLDRVRGNQLIEHLNYHQKLITQGLKQISQTIIQRIPLFAHVMLSFRYIFLFNLSQKFIPNSTYRFGSLSSLTNKEDEINREVNALALLAQLPFVRLKTNSIEDSIKKKFNIDENSEIVNISSSDLKKMIRENHFSISVITDSQLPLFSVKSKKSNITETVRKLGINPIKGQRMKIMKLRPNIDDHMLNVRIKQMEEFIKLDHTVTIMIQLPKIKSKLCNSSKSYRDLRTLKSSQQQDSMFVVEKNENLQIAKLNYETELKRCKGALSQIPNCTYRILDRPNYDEIVIILQSVKRK